MARRQKFLEPIEWRNISDQTKKVNMLTRLFFCKVSITPMFVNKRLSSNYLKLRTYFRKLDKYQQHKIYDYLWSIPEYTPMELYDVIVASEKYVKEQQIAADKAKNEALDVKPYDDYETILKEWGINI